MRVFRLSDRAKEDLNGIWVYIATTDFDAADRVEDEIMDQIRSLTQQPGKGHFRADVAHTQYRFWKVYSYLIIYSYTDAELIVSRIIHGARDIGSILR